ncbi:Dehydrogenase azaJ [Lasiodiplodia theobromae]|uniref:Dehydrogenase azaJ n=1 Tax=Lasiodiplodia theobromae TaxID=45133 RepID=A0A5N5D5J1_9PEZI|nr:Dehydrogenase azaJ [Lasiodiplodia theobromae]
MTKNQAAWIDGPRVKPLKVAEAPDRRAGPGEVVIKNAALAINPIDWLIQDKETLPVTYPAILGSDIAGVVEEVGEGVTCFKKGQHVIALCHAILSQKQGNGGFQLYSCIPEILVSPIPDDLSFEQAVVLPLALATAAAGIYGKTVLNLPLPPADGTRSTADSGTLLVWGAASSVGTAVIQLARASGLHVVATASARNHDFVKSLGANEVFDYKSPDANHQIVTALEKRADSFVGVFDCISEQGTYNQIGAILDDFQPAKVAVVLYPFPEKIPKSIQPLMTISYTIPLPENEHIADAIWRKYFPEALAKGLFQAKPDPLVFGSGLEALQGAMERHKQGVSAQKIVVTL